MKLILALFLGLLLSGTAVHAISDVPNVVNYQGKLLNASGSAVSDGTYSVQFKIYNAATGTAFLWGGSYNVLVSAGYFNVMLGEGGSAIAGASYASISDALGSTSTPYLGLTITSDSSGAISSPSEISPRMRFLSSPYAVSAQNARSADNATSANNAQTVGNLPASSFLQPANSAASTLNGNLTVPNLTVNAALNVNGSAGVAGNLAVNGTLSVGATSGGGFTPVGGIIMWAGPVSDVPVGWALCNGSGTFSRNGTTYTVPDLRDRFVVGAGNAYASRATGGSASVTLGSNHIPQHRHTYKDGFFAEAGLNGSGHDGPDALGQFYDAGNYYVGSKSGWDWDNSIGGIYRYTSYTGGNGSGNADAFDPRPPYYALAYLIRIN